MCFLVKMNNIKIPVLITNPKMNYSISSRSEIVVYSHILKVDKTECQPKQLLKMWRQPHTLKVTSSVLY